MGEGAGDVGLWIDGEVCMAEFGGPKVGVVGDGHRGDVLGLEAAVMVVGANGYGGDGGFG